MKKTLLIAIIFFATLGFNFTLENDINEKYYEEALFSVCKIISKNIELNILSGIQFSEINNLLEKSKLLISNNLSNLLASSNLNIIPKENKFINISLVHKNGNILISTNNVESYKNELSKLVKDLKKNENVNEDTYFLNDNLKYNIFFKILSGKENQDHFVYISVEKHLFIDSVAKEKVKYAFNLFMLFVFVVAFFILIANIFFYENFYLNNYLTKKIKVLLFIAILAPQVLMSYANYNKLEKIFFNCLNITIENIDNILEINMQKNAEEQRHKISLKKFSKIDSIKYLTQNIENFVYDNAINFKKTELSENVIENSSTILSQKILVKIINYLFEIKRFTFYIEDENGDINQIYLYIYPTYYGSTIFNIIINSSIKILITILFFYELIYFYEILIEKKHVIFNNCKKYLKEDRYKYMRTAAFIFIFGIDLSISFVPIFARELYLPILELSENTIIGLPITVEFIFVGISIFTSGVWSDRRGWHEPFVCGALLCAIANIACFTAENLFIFISLRALVGFGYGLILLASQAFIINYSSINNRTFAIAQFISGIYAGSICGAATGAILSEILGYNTVFLIGGLVLLIIIPYYFFILKNIRLKKEVKNFENLLGLGKKIQPFENRDRYKKESFSKHYIGENKLKKTSLIKFMKNKIVISLILFSSFPAAIGTVGFLNYFTPIYLKDIGVSPAIIGSVYIIYGLSLVYIGPTISKLADKSKNKKYFIFIGCSVASVTFIIFYFATGLFITLLAALLLGISSSLIIASQSSYLLSLEITKRFGEGKALGIFRATSRAGQAAGPIIFSFVFLGEKISNNMAKMGLFYLLSSLLFLIITNKDNYIQKEK
jgi:MFS family permease